MTSFFPSFHFFRSVPRYFWVLFLIFTLTFGVLFLDRFRTYSSQVTVLVVHKNEKTAASANQVVDNIASFPARLSFYDRLLKKYPEVSDPWSGMDAEHRQALWAEYVSATQVNTSGLIDIRVKADSASDSALLAQRVVANLFQTVSLYYDIRNEIDIRTVDGPLTKVGIIHPFGWFLSSLVSGFVAAGLLSSGIRALGEVKGHAGRASSGVGKESENVLKIREMLKPHVDQDIMGKHVQSVPWVLLHNKNNAQNVSSQPTEHDPLDPFVDQVNAPAPEVMEEKLMPAPGSVKSRETTLEKEAVSKSPSNLPGNLPFLEENVSLEEYLFGKSTDESSERKPEGAVSGSPLKKDESESVVAKESSGKATDPIYTEPTEEERKRRLNQLLKGEM